MKKITLSVVMAMSAIALIAAPAGPVATQKQTPQLKNTNDSLAYAVGIFWGESLNDINENYEATVDPELVFQTMRDHLADRATMSYKEAEEWIKNYWYYRLPAIRQAKWDIVADSLMAANPNIKQTESGLLYEIFDEGGKQHPRPYDQVVVRYTKTLLDGTRVTRSNEANSQNDTDNVLLDVYNLIAGCREGVQLVGKGGHIKMWLNPGLASGAEYGDAKEDQFLVFDYQLREIISGDDDSEEDDEIEDGTDLNERKYDEGHELIQYPDYEPGYVWKRTKRSNTIIDHNGNTWKRVKVKK